MKFLSTNETAVRLFTKKIAASVSDGDRPAVVAALEELVTTYFSGEKGFNVAAPIATRFAVKVTELVSPSGWPSEAVKTARTSFVAGFAGPENVRFSPAQHFRTLVDGRSELNASNSLEGRFAALMMLRDSVELTREIENVRKPLKLYLTAAELLTYDDEYLAMFGRETAAQAVLEGERLLLGLPPVRNFENGFYKNYHPLYLGVAAFDRVMRLNAPLPKHIALQLSTHIRDFYALSQSLPESPGAIPDQASKKIVDAILALTPDASKEWIQDVRALGDAFDAEARSIRDGLNRYSLLAHSHFFEFLRCVRPHKDYLVVNVCNQLEEAKNEVFDAETLVNYIEEAARALELLGLEKLLAHPLNGKKLQAITTELEVAVILDQVV